MSSTVATRRVILLLLSAVLVLSGIYWRPDAVAASASVDVAATTMAGMPCEDGMPMSPPSEEAPCEKGCCMQSACDLSACLGSGMLSFVTLRVPALGPLSMPISGHSADAAAWQFETPLRPPIARSV